jgi:cystathionine beta-lyase/cystathionine gamma-synthase
MYSTTVRLFEFLAKNFGIEVVFSDSTKTEQYIEEIGKGARLVWLETPSNPLLEISDIQAIANAAHKTGAVLAVDNTFATPFNQRPLSLGADIVIHSATKFLGGHSDVTAGLLVSSRNNVKKARDVGLKFLGASAAPQAAWLVLRGVKTLALRMERHNENAQELAKRLAEHLGAEKVFYPGLASSINHEIAKKQMSGFGGILSLDAGDEEAAKRFVSKCRLCTFATSLGGVETLVQPVALMTHATLDSEAKKRAGIKEGLLRISVGIENIEDIWEDVYNSLQNL